MGLRDSWEHATTTTKAMIAGGLLVVAAGWITYMLWPVPPVEIQPEGDAKAQLDASRADQDALAAMSEQELKAEVKRREDALTKANRSGDGEQISAAMDALARAKESLQGRGTPAPGKGS